METRETVSVQERRERANEVMTKYGLRWAVMAAWQAELARRAVPLPRSVASAMEGARAKIASGCFTPCEIGCDLGAVEAELTAADASSADVRVDFWLGLLGEAMSEEFRAEEVLRIPAVKIAFSDCQLVGCTCAG